MECLGSLLAPREKKLEAGTGDEERPLQARVCQCCGSPMRIIEVFGRGCSTDPGQKSGGIGPTTGTLDLPIAPLPVGLAHFAFEDLAGRISGEVWHDDHSMVALITSRQPGVDPVAQ